MNFFAKWKQRFMSYFTPRPLSRRNSRYLRLMEYRTDEQAAQLMNSLYWPKVSMTCSSEPPRSEPNWTPLHPSVAETMRHYSSKTKRTR
jgi:hypothetical protein